MRHFISAAERAVSYTHLDVYKRQHAFIEACLLSSVSDDTPEGKSIIELGRESGLRMRNLNTDGDVYKRQDWVITHGFGTTLVVLC